jgi:hypothetical protein
VLKVIYLGNLLGDNTIEKIPSKKDRKSVLGIFG